MGAEAPPLRIEDAHSSIQHKGLAVKLGLVALAAIALAIMLLATFKPYLHGGPFKPIVEGLMTSSIVLVVLALFTRIHSQRLPGAVSVEGGCLVIERGRRLTRIPLSELAEGSLRPMTRSLEITRRNGDIVRVDVQRVEDGQRLLAAARLDASGRTLRVLLGETAALDRLSMIFGPFVALVLAGLVRVHADVRGSGGVALFMVLFLLFLAGIFAAARELFGPAQIVVGADGIVVRQSFRRRFFRYEQIAEIDAVMERAKLMLKDGTVVPLRTKHLSSHQHAELLSRLDDARRARTLGEGGSATLAELDRSGRSIAAWRAALGVIMAQHNAYRGRALTRGELLDVLENPAASIERRVAAALALAGDDEARGRMRIAADAAADARVRVALLEAAEGSLDDEALEAITREAERRRTTA